MRQISLTELSLEEFKDLVADSVREELKTALPSAINQALSTPPEDRLVPRSEGLKQIGVKSRDTALRLEEAGTLERIQIRGRIYYRASNLQELIRKRRP